MTSIFRHGERVIITSMQQHGRRGFIVGIADDRDENDGLLIEVMIDGDAQSTLHRSSVLMKDIPLS